MSWRDKIYHSAPVFIQNAIVSTYGYTWKKRRFGGIFKHELNGYKERENFSKNDWDNYSTEKLTQILSYAFENVPYYKNAWTELGFTSERIKKLTPETLHQLPFLEKDELRWYGKTELIASKTEAGGTFFASSGTTGTPTSILFSEAMHQRWSAAFEARIRNWSGLTMNNSRGMIGGRKIIADSKSTPPYYRYNMFEKQVYFSAYHISLQNAENYLEGLRKYKPDYMNGYAVSNYLLAVFFDKLKIQPPELKAVITSSEKLTADMRAMLNKVYNCKTYDSYSGVEACSLISECEYGGLHISPDVGLVEFINDAGLPAKPGEIAEMVCTGFLNYDQPLIRYKIGDKAVWDDSSCMCGRNMPMVKEITGRDEDVITTKDGRRMVRFHGIFIDIENVRQGQVIQESLDAYTVKVISDRQLSKEDRNKIITRMQLQVGTDTVINVEEVNEISAGANGKFKAVISHLKQ